MKNATELFRIVIALTSCVITGGVLETGANVLYKVVKDLAPGFATHFLLNIRPIQIWRNLRNSKLSDDPIHNLILDTSVVALNLVKEELLKNYKAQKNVLFQDSNSYKAIIQDTNRIFNEMANDWEFWKDGDLISDDQLLLPELLLDELCNYVFSVSSSNLKEPKNWEDLKEHIRERLPICFHNAFKSAIIKPSNAEAFKSIQFSLLKEIYDINISSYENSLKAIEELKTIRNEIDKLNVSNIVRTIQPKLDRRENSECSPVVYRSRAIQLVGRDNEIQALKDFCFSSEHFEWLAMLGDSGIGKSRLALEYSIFLADNHGWHAGFISNNELSNFCWNEWLPNRDTLIVVDYAASQYRQLSIALKEFDRQESFYSRRVRVLIIERSLNDLWYPILENAQFTGTIKKCWNTALYVQPLSPIDVLKLTNNILDYLNSSFKFDSFPIWLQNFNRPENPLHLILKVFDEYASINSSSTDIYGLVSGYINREEFSVWEKVVPNDCLRMKHKRLLVLITMLGGVSFEELGQILNLENALLPNESDYNEVFFINSKLVDFKNRKIFGITPHLIGGYFIVSNLLKASHTVNLSDSSELRELVELAWDLDRNAMLETLLRLTTDFIEFKGIKLLLPTLKFNPTESEFANWSEVQREYLLKKAANAFIFGGLPIPEWNEYLDVLLSHPFPEIQILSILSGLEGMAIGAARNGYIEESKSFHSDLLKWYQSGFNGAEIVESFCRISVDLFSYYRNVFDYNTAEYYFFSLREFNKTSAFPDISNDFLDKVTYLYRFDKNLQRKIKVAHERLNDTNGYDPNISDTELKVLVEGVYLLLYDAANRKKDLVVAAEHLVQLNNLANFYNYLTPQKYYLHGLNCMLLHQAKNNSVDESLLESMEDVLTRYNSPELFEIWLDTLLAMIKFKIFRNYSYAKELFDKADHVSKDGSLSKIGYMRYWDIVEVMVDYHWKLGNEKDALFYFQKIKNMQDLPEKAWDLPIIVKGLYRAYRYYRNNNNSGEALRYKTEARKLAADLNLNVKFIELFYNTSYPSELKTLSFSKT